MNMNDNYSYHFGQSILFLEFHEQIKEDSISTAYKEIKGWFPDTEIKVVAYKNILGYWAARDIINDKSIYCGTMSLKTTKEQITKYLENDKS